jgi:hypothetical protein
VHAAVTRESQESGRADAITASSQDPGPCSNSPCQDNPARFHANTNAPGGRSKYEKEDREAEAPAQETPADLKRWFQEFAEAVPDEEDSLYTTTPFPQKSSLNSSKKERI